MYTPSILEVYKYMAPFAMRYLYCVIILTNYVGT